MVMLKYPSCGGDGLVGIAPLRSMEAIAADMLEKGVIFRYGNWELYANDFSSIACPPRGATLLNP